MSSDNLSIFGNLDYLFTALKSIFNQSYKNFKILVVYDDEDKSDLSKIKKFLKVLG